MSHAIHWTTSTELIALDVTPEEPLRGGHAGVRLGEARNPGPVEHERDLAEEEHSARRTRTNEAGDAVPGSQDSITRGVQNLLLGDILAVQPDEVNTELRR